MQSRSGVLHVCRDHVSRMQQSVWTLRVGAAKRQVAHARFVERPSARADCEAEGHRGCSLCHESRQARWRVTGINASGS